jgi:hypothetical protein
LRYNANLHTIKEAGPCEDWAIYRRESSKMPPLCELRNGPKQDAGGFDVLVVVRPDGDYVGNRVIKL